MTMIFLDKNWRIRIVLNIKKIVIIFVTSQLRVLSSSIANTSVDNKFTNLFDTNLNGPALSKFDNK